MDITFTIKITEKQIPEMIGLLAKMWDNPDPTKNFEIHEEPGQKTVWVKKEAVSPESSPEASPVTATVAPEATVAATVPNTPARPNAAQIQAAAGAFMAIDESNITVLQGIMREMGVTAFPQFNEAQLDKFAQRLRGLGVAI